MCRTSPLWSLFVLFKEKASSAMSEAVRPRRTFRGGLMPGLMEYVSPISRASRVWLGLPAREAALILALHPADSQHSEQLIRHGAAEAVQDRCRDENRRFESPMQPERPAGNPLFSAGRPVGGPIFYIVFPNLLLFNTASSAVSAVIYLYFSTNALVFFIFKMIHVSFLLWWLYSPTIG